MSIDSKFGFIALLDAIGTRTATLENANRYLSKVESLKEDIVACTLATVKEIKEEELRLSFADLKPRFFGDSILLSYEVKEPEHFKDYLDRIIFVLSSFIPIALKHGIPVRGALAIGKYIEESNVVLGPAVNDAANWYEQQDMISVMTTPKAVNYIKGALLGLKDDTVDLARLMRGAGLISYDIPVKNGKISSYVVDWPDMIHEQKPLLYYYRALDDFEIPFGSESKYLNTESLVKYSISLRSKIAQGNQ